MNTNVLRNLAIVGFLLLFSQPSQASLVEKDDAVFGTDAITLDTDTNFEWLDLAYSSGLSRSYINTQFGEGGEFAGWRYATLSEAVALWTSASSGYSDTTEAVENWVSFVGRTGTQWGYPQILSVTGSGQVVGANYVKGSGWQTGDIGMSWGAGMTAGSNWLVREVSAVPAPAAAWLLGTGILGLAGLRRKAKRA